MQQQKKKGMLPCVIVVLFIVGLVVIAGCGGASSGETSNTPISSSTTAPQTVVENAAVPSNYVTYTDKSQLYSISYPSGWEVDSDVIAHAEDEVKNWINSKDSSLHVKEACVLFLGGKKADDGYTPNISIIVEPLPRGVKTIDQLVETQLEGMESSVDDYVLISSVKTTISGRKASIQDVESTIQYMDTLHLLQAVIFTDANSWSVICTSTLEDYNKWENDFQSIVRSLRILK